MPETFRSLRKFLVVVVALCPFVVELNRRI